MKIEEVMFVEAAPARVDAATRNARANRALALNAKLNAPEEPAAAPEAPEEPATKPAVQRPKADPFAQMVNQLQPPQQSSTGGTTTQIAGGTRHTANPNNPNLKQPAAPAAAAEPAPAANANYGQAGAGIKNVQATPTWQPGLGKKPAADPAAQKKDREGIEKNDNLPAPAFLRGLAKGAGANQLAQAIDTAAQSNIDTDLQKKQVGAKNAEIDKANAGIDAANPAAQEPGKDAAGATGAATPAKAAAGPVAAKPVTAAAKTMSKQEILAWISRHNDPDMVKDLIALKTGITAAEKGAPAAAAEKPAAVTTSNAPKDDATAAASGYGPKKGATSMNTTVKYAQKEVPAATAPDQQKQMDYASKQYKKAPL